MQSESKKIVKRAGIGVLLLAVVGIAGSLWLKRKKKPAASWNRRSVID